MFLKLAHYQLEVYKCSKELVVACYKLTAKFPDAERFGLVHQIRKAANSSCLNTSEGCSRKSVAERKRFYEIARGSVIEIDTALDIAYNLSYCSNEELKDTGIIIVKMFRLLSGMINK